MNTLFDKIWDAHVVQKVEDGPTQLYIDRLYCHEVTSPQAFAGLRARGIKCFRPEKIFCMPEKHACLLRSGCIRCRRQAGEKACSAGKRLRQMSVK